jgi:hypothetical protein
LSEPEVELGFPSHMRESSFHALATLILLLALGTLILAMVGGGDISMIVFGLLLAATSMKLFRHAQQTSHGED